MRLQAAGSRDRLPVMELQTPDQPYEPPMVADLDDDGPSTVCAMLQQQTPVA
jgi:hypothetical protein